VFCSASNNYIGPPYTHIGNVFTGSPTPAATQSFGALKAKYR
jgi:hypothetical protein